MPLSKVTMFGILAPTFSFMGSRIKTCGVKSLSCNICSTIDYKSCLRWFVSAAWRLKETSSIWKRSSCLSPITGKFSPIFTESYQSHGRCLRNCTLSHRIYGFPGGIRPGWAFRLGWRRTVCKARSHTYTRAVNFCTLKTAWQLKEYVFHNLPRFIAILNVFFQRDLTVMLEKLQVEGDDGDSARSTQMHGHVEGFLLHGLLPSNVIRLLLKPLVQTQQDLHLIMELLEKMGVCYCVNKPRSKPLNGATVWYKFPSQVSSEVPHPEASASGGSLIPGQFFSVEQLQIEYRFPFFTPLGLFARYSVQINSHVVQRSDGKHHIFAYRGKVPVTVSYRPSRSRLQPETLSISSHASLPNIWTAWQAIIPLVEELNVLLQEWPGLHYSVHVLCSKCLKRGSSNPHSFPG